MYNKLADGTWEFIGRSARDSEIKTTSNGKDMVTFSIMYHKDEKTGESKYMKFCAFSPFAEKAKTITRGSVVHAYGRLDQHEYTTRDGETKMSSSIWVDWLDVQNKNSVANNDNDYVPYAPSPAPTAPVSRGTTSDRAPEPSTANASTNIGGGFDVDYSDFDGDIFI